MVNVAVIRGKLESMAWLNVILLLYALLTITMGFVGYFRANSIWSLVGGTACGIVVLASVFMSKRKPRASRITALVVALVLVGMFFMGTLQNQLYPAGVMFGSSVAVAICLGAAHMMAMRAKKKKKVRESATV
jgi:uncharacterized membrane protein (UPF0136 family)